ncbi:patellin-4 [Iris pallida]|uniref:Patellin-4 n=1 Tax=Iris pallida TaxID=29817 RepID=A0AAX6E8A4_IRIPA|nr:patellin-4 [Iris pallida]
MASPEPVGEGLKPSEKKALAELRLKLEEAISANQLLSPPPPEKSKNRVTDSGPGPDQDPQDGAALWGVPLLPSRGHDGTDAILLKFLRAREFRPSEALEMLQKALRWRRDFGIDTAAAAEVEIGLPEVRAATYMNGVDRDGHPVCYNSYSVFRRKDLYRTAFGSEETREKFLRWRVQFMETGIRQLSFKPGGVASMIQVIDLKDSMSSSMKEIRSMVKKLALIFQDNYPEFVAKYIFINVSFRYYACHALFSELFTQRTKNKFVFARPNKVTETLLRFIAPERIPIQYGGLHREDDEEFSPENGKVSERVLKANGSTTVEIPVVEPGVTVVWDLAVVGWDVYYKEVFIPDDECSYEVLIQKEQKLEENVRNSFYINEPGKVVLTIDNRTYKRKRILYRSKSKPTIPLYNMLSHPVVKSRKSKSY